jgi:hypothetical protein
MATANIANTKVVPTETTALPYYDDFDESKNFHRILFRPGYAVQARELTQLQTILQNQIERFGNHIFKNGSIVLGGQLSVDTRAKYINLVSTYANTDVTAAVFKSNAVTFTSGNSAVIAYVSATAEATNTAPPVLMVKYLSGREFPNNTTLMSNVGYYANIATTAHTGTGSLVSLNDSIFFINGYFVKVPSQTIVLDRFGTRANAKVGLEFTEAIVDETSDTSLLDPAQEASNYQAPGATRLKINFDLVTRTLDSIDDERFVELLRIENGAVKKMIRYPIYSELGDTMARRTFDESGNYTVRRFRANVNDHPTDNTKFQITLDPGKAYIKGYEYESIAQISLDVDRARANTSVINREMTVNYGNYVYVDNMKGYFDTASMQNVEFYNSKTSAIGVNTKIGTGRFRTINYYSASNTQNLATATYTISLFDTSFTGANSLAYANSISTTTGNADISLLSKDNGLANGLTVISDSTFNSLVYTIGNEFIVPSTIQNQDYSYLKQADITFSGGSATITSATGETFVGVTDGTGRSASTLSSFMVFRTNGTRVDLTSVTVAEPTATLTSTTFTTGTAKVFYKVYLNSGSSIVAKTKTRVTANTTHFSTHAANNTFVANETTTRLYGGSGQVTITAPSLVPGTKMSLFYTDVNQVTKIYDLNGAAIPSAGASLSSYSDVTSKYVFDDGQKDSHYDHSTISLAPRRGTPKGPLIVCFDWFQHSGSAGYFSVDSYSNIDYGIIPSYTSSSGTIYSLRDSIDFRPKRANESNTNINYTISGNRIPVTGTPFTFDYNYFLARRAFVLITKQGDIPFKILDGEPSQYPIEPRPDQDSMILYKMFIEPYTASTNNVYIEFVENKRYTMRDIGKLETRIENLEYYQTLSILEKSTTDMSIVDVNGLERTKYGIIADNFTTHGYGEVLNPDYFIAVDRVYGGATPPQEAVLMPLYKQSNNSTKVSGSTITLSYTEENFITQNLATKWVPVQPYMLAQWVGQVNLSPESDIWIETNQAPDVIINLGENDALIVADAINPTTRQAQLRANAPLITESFAYSTLFGSKN